MGPEANYFPYPKLESIKCLSQPFLEGIFILILITYSHSFMWGLVGTFNIYAYFGIERNLLLILVKEFKNQMTLVTYSKSLAQASDNV